MCYGNNHSINNASTFPKAQNRWKISYEQKNIIYQTANNSYWQNVVLLTLFLSVQRRTRFKWPHKNSIVMMLPWTTNIFPVKWQTDLSSAAKVVLMAASILAQLPSFQLWQSIKDNSNMGQAHQCFNCDYMGHATFDKMQKSLCQGLRLWKRSFYIDCRPRGLSLRVCEYGHWDWANWQLWSIQFFSCPYCIAFKWANQLSGPTFC